MVIAVVDVVLSAIAVLQAFKALQTALKGVAGKKALRTSAQNEMTGEKLPNSQGGECNQGKCFIAGTKVKTEDGYKNIEEVEVGDKVLAYDEETGKQAYKEVVRLFRGKTEEWYHVFAEGEEIVCTGGHRFYVEGKGFVEAKDLTKEDKLTLSDGRQVKIEKIEKEELAKAETKYNFEVKDFHTYYVTENDVLVHNDCGFDTLYADPEKLIGKSADDIADMLGDGWTRTTYGSKKNGWRFMDKHGSKIAYHPAGGRHETAYYILQRAGDKNRLKLIGRGYKTLNEKNTLYHIVDYIIS